MNVLFSIIVPIYNKEKYIKECIDSILNQSYKDFELILVDDGSTDGCRAICDEYNLKDNRIKVIHKENGGLVSARKIGCKLATGIYIICVDGDDYIKNDYLLNIKKEIDKNKPDLVCTGHKILHGKEKLVKNYFDEGFYSRKDIENKIFPYLLQSKDASYFPVNIWAKAFKKELYSKIQLEVNNSISIGEDGCVSIPYIYYANSLSVINDHSYIYRHNDDSMTSKKIVLDLDYPRKVYYSITKYIDMDIVDFKKQSYRFIVHQLFSLVLSVFNIDKTYKEIEEIIINLLNDDFYRDAINNAKFTTIRARFMHFLLNKRLVYIIYIVSRFY